MNEINVFFDCNFALNFLTPAFLGIFFKSPMFSLKMTCLYFSALEIVKMFAGTDSLDDRALASSGTSTDTSAVAAGEAETFL